MQADYNKEFDIDKDGKVTVRDVRSRWQTVINLLTKNIQFKSTFLAGLYAGIRLGWFFAEISIVGGLRML